MPLAAQFCSMGDTARHFLANTLNLFLNLETSLHGSHAKLSWNSLLVDQAGLGFRDTLSGAALKSCATTTDLFYPCELVWNIRSVIYVLNSHLKVLLDNSYFVFIV